MGAQKAEATELPPPIVEYLTKTYPGINIRFDGLIELADGTTYLPVIPVVYAEHEGAARVTMSVPEKAEKPDLMIFANNLSLLKVIQDENNDKTVISGSNVPLKVKLGLLPQDLVVPQGLVIPSDMGSILGDLVVPSTSSELSKMLSKELPIAPANKQEDNATVPSQQEIQPDQTSVTITPVEQVPVVSQQVVQPVGDLSASTRLPGLNDDSLFGLNGRLLYIANITGNILYIVDPQMSKVVSTVKISSLPFNLVLGNDLKTLYLVCLAGNSVAAVDIKNDRVENIIKVGLRPVDIAITPDGSKLFVTNSGSGNISVIDTSVFEIINTVGVQGIPDGIVASNDNVSFYTFNRASGIVSKWNSIDTEQRKFLFMVKNPYAMVVNPSETKLYVTSRTENNLMIYDLVESKYDGVVEVGDKPLDILVSPDEQLIFVLEAGDDRISYIDASTHEILGSIDLMTGGFPSSMVLLPNKKMVLVTNAESDKLTLVDLDAKKVVTTIPIGITSKTLVIGPTTTEQLKQIQIKQKEQELLKSEQ
ncbi:MAG: hypothetical protein AB7V50_01405 [Vampirovibrionia bacterium]